jgi:hypothetical protein
MRMTSRLLQDFVNGAKKMTAPEDRTAQDSLLLQRFRACYAPPVL